MNNLLRHFFLRARCDEGGAILELAVALPFILLLVVGVADYGRLYYTGIAVASAVEAGVHYGVAYDGNVDSMTASTRRDGAGFTFDTINAGKFCRCPDTGVVDCAATTCGVYGAPQIFDSVRVREDVVLLVHYVGLPATVTVTRTAILRQR